MKVRHYLVVFERGPRNWSAFAPDVPGCIGTAPTRDELAREMADALTFHFEGLRIDGAPIPEPVATPRAGWDASYVEVVVPDTPSRQDRASD